VAFKFCLKPSDFELQLSYRSILIVLLISCCLGKGIRECQGARSRYVRGIGQGLGVKVQESGSGVMQGSGVQGTKRVEGR